MQNLVKQHVLNVANFHSALIQYKHGDYMAFFYH